MSPLSAINITVYIQTIEISFLIKIFLITQVS